MFIAKKFFETNRGPFKKGAEVPAEIAERFADVVEEVDTPGGVKEELLLETPSSVIVEIDEDEETDEAVIEDNSKKNKKNK
jgi:hypothetical protein